MAILPTNTQIIFAIVVCGVLTVVSPKQKIFFSSTEQKKTQRETDRWYKPDVMSTHQKKHPTAENECAR